MAVLVLRGHGDHAYGIPFPGVSAGADIEGHILNNVGMMSAECISMVCEACMYEDCACDCHRPRLEVEGEERRDMAEQKAAQCPGCGNSWYKPDFCNEPFHKPAAQPEAAPAQVLEADEKTEKVFARWGGVLERLADGAAPAAPQIPARWRQRFSELVSDDLPREVLESGYKEAVLELERAEAALAAERERTLEEAAEYIERVASYPYAKQLTDDVKRILGLMPNGIRALARPTESRTEETHAKLP